MKPKEEKEELLDKKSRLMAELDDVQSQLEWSYADNGRIYRIELITSGQVRIQFDQSIEIVMRNNIFEGMYKFYQKLNGETIEVKSTNNEKV